MTPTAPDASRPLDRIGQMLAALDPSLVGAEMKSYRKSRRRWWQFWK